VLCPIAYEAASGFHRSETHNVPSIPRSPRCGFRWEAVDCLRYAPVSFSVLPNHHAAIANVVAYNPAVVPPRSHERCLSISPTWVSRVHPPSSTKMWTRYTQIFTTAYLSIVYCSMRQINRLLQRTTRHRIRLKTFALHGIDSWTICVSCAILDVVGRVSSL